MQSLRLAFLITIYYISTRLGDKNIKITLEVYSNLLGEKCKELKRRLLL